MKGKEVCNLFGKGFNEDVVECRECMRLSPEVADECKSGMKVKEKKERKEDRVMEKQEKVKVKEKERVKKTIFGARIGTIRAKIDAGIVKYGIDAEKIAKVTGIPKGKINRRIKKLIDKKLISKNGKILVG